MEIRVSSLTESESEESKHFYFFRFRLWSSETRLLELEEEVEEPINHKAQNQALWLVYFSASALDSDNLVFTRT